MCDFALRIDSPRVGRAELNVSSTMSLSSSVWGGDWFKPLEARAATPPPLGASSNLTASGWAITSWKNPFKQSVMRNTGNCE